MAGNIDQRRFEQLNEEVNRPRHRLPFGVVYAYAVVAAEDPSFRFLAVSFDSEGLTELAANSGTCHERGWGLLPKVVRISVICIEGAWHKVNIRSINAMLMMSLAGDSEANFTSVNFSPESKRYDSNKLAALLKSPVRIDAATKGVGVRNDKVYEHETK